MQTVWERAPKPPSGAAGPAHLADRIDLPDRRVFIANVGRVEAIVGAATARSAYKPPSTLTAEVVRTRLLPLLDARFDRSVTTVLAGAGFGKTTLLAQAFRRNLADPLGIDAWVSCQPDDQDPEAFVAACCRAAGVEPARSVHRSTDVLAAIREVSPIDVCLVIDDVHELIGSRSEAIVADVTRRLPSNGHLVLSGRASIDVALARLRAGGRCVEIGEDELAFTSSEERELAALLEAPPSGRKLAGWPALTRLALTTRPTAPYEFLWEEIVRGLSPGLQRALLALALVGWADGPALSKLCGETVDVAEVAAKVPLVSISPDGTARAHDLWTESLPRLYTPAQTGEIMPLVCETLLVRDDSLRLAAIAARFGNLDTIRVAARELVRHTVAHVPVRRARTLLAAAGDDRDRGPELLLLQAALAHAAAVDDPRIDKLLADAGAAFVAEGDEPGEVAALLLAGQVASSRGAYHQFLQIALRVAELPTARGNLMLHVVAQLVTATLAELKGDVAEGLEALAKLPPPEAHYPLREVVCRLHVYLLVTAGRADEAAPIADAALRGSSHPHVRTIPPFVHWSAGDPSEMEVLRGSVKPARETNARDRFFYAALGSYVHASTGETAKLQALADQLETMPTNEADPRDASMVAASSATRLVAMHDEEGARALLIEHLNRHSFDDPRCDLQLRRALVTVYVCAPAVRAVWDTARLGQCHRRMHATARALVRARELSPARTAPGDHRDHVEDLSAVLEDADALMTMAPLPLAVELSARAHGLGLAAGSRAIDVLRHRIGEPVTAELQWQRGHGDESVRSAAHDLLDASRQPEARTVRIEVLGPTCVLVDGLPTGNASARRGRVRQLLALLAVEPTLRRERAMALLWPELDQTAASRNLRVTLSYLRQVFRDPGPGSEAAGPTLDERFVLVDSASIRLVPYPGLEVDLWQLDAHIADAARAHGAGDLTMQSNALGAAAALWRGEPLVDLSDFDEMAGEVTRVRTALIDCALTLGEIRLTEGRIAESVRHAQAVLAADPYIERAHRLAIAGQIHLGDHVAAREAAERMGEALGEVGATPTDVTKILLRRVATLGSDIS